MTLQDQMAADMASVFLNSSEFAQAATYLPKNIGATPFALVITPSDPAPSLAQIGTGMEDRRPADFLASYAAVRAGILAGCGVARDPMHGDLITIAAGAFAAIWKVNTFHADEGGGVMIQVVFSAIYAPGGQTAREVR